MENQQDEILKGQNITPLYIPEVYLLLKKLEDHRTHKQKEVNQNYQHFEQYIKEITPFKEDEEIQNLRTQLMTDFGEKIEQNTLVEIVNILPNTVDEARSLIRDLCNTDEDLIQQIIDTLNNFQKI